ncbi:CHAD domain-containing protein [Rhizobium leguminosarum]|jgi:CHAD domain-containing protein|uniref:CHAD domain-containing protein n=1 Tax=Rhizobium leguminosarum TaxID=384 RepID=A0A444HSL1_RHILE|nr:CHAD domain-containing protein [Rhizobium leguminosarum]MBY5460183.1 CHAD domain-containing protein [Rhizobium leguminosarum]RWX26170.1 CHAD domain-containing protein [Rhizobium leguminosarum]TBC95995.1 CHAD domain-containing protein [Rhizobium leguminosarum]TBD06454.1 CHAD domain-containing protein [Rhizobium leguminosarum]UIJ79247.1 CHAD domain-containing protein [Rhizobium leguminosarum]
MAYRIRPDADFTEAFRNAATRQLEHAITVLGERPDGAHEAIHSFRKNLKRLRSLYRLVAREVPDFQAQENARLRDAARSLSAIRDATALIGTAQYLQHAARGNEESEALGRIVTILEGRRAWMAEAESGLEQRLAETSDVLKEAIAALDAVSFDRGHRKNARMLAKSWRRTARKAQTALAACHGEASADDFHDLRKRTYDYRLYHALLRDVWPGAMKAKREAAKELVEDLGHIHDLTVLSELVEAEPQLFTRNDDLARLLDIIIFRQQEDRRQALIKAEAVFADDADEEAQRIELLWLMAGS